jgi:DNA-binding MarR family transcriptional regulator
VSDDQLSMADYRALVRFRHALRVFLGFSEQAARDAGIAPAQHQLMLAIKGWGGDGEPTISDIAELLVLRHHSVVELVQRARAAGLVVTRDDAVDHRRQRLALTPDGAERLAALSLLHRDELRRFRRDMSAVLDELTPIDSEPNPR